MVYGEAKSYIAKVIFFFIFASQAANLLYTPSHPVGGSTEEDRRWCSCTGLRDGNDCVGNNV